MAWRARARLAARLRSSAGGMPASAGSCSTGVGCKHPVITCTVQLGSHPEGGRARLCSTLGRSIQLAHTQVPGQRRGVPMDPPPPSCTHKFADECTACHDLISDYCSYLPTEVSKSVLRVKI